jgi:hypothetical protein
MNVRKNLYASICVNILVLGIFLLMLPQLDVFMQLLFSFVPIILSIIVSALINRDKNPEKDNYLQCAAICSGFNFISLVVEYICISAVAGANDIYEVSQKYNSEYVTVSENNSPIFSIIVFSIASFVLHYFVMKKVGNKKKI